MGKYYIKPSVNGQFYFVLTSENGQVILTSETYTTKQNCENGIASVRQNSPYDSNYKKLVSSNNQYYFTLVASNHQVIGTSEMYTTSYSRDEGISSVKKNGPTSTLG